VRKRQHEPSHRLPGGPEWGERRIGPRRHATALVDRGEIGELPESLDGQQHSGRRAEHVDGRRDQSLAVRRE
jgi:hypothetical protein